MKRQKRVATKARTKTKTKKGQTKRMTKAVTPEIVREGEKIILPPGMTYAVARDWLTKQEHAEEQIVNIADNIPCYPLDGILALWRAFTDKFGFVTVTGQGWWGDSPPTMIQLTTPSGIETVPYGIIKAPRWEGGYLNADFAGPSINVLGKTKKKFEGEVKEIISLTKKMLKEKSIYRGQAIHVNLHWWNDPEEFHPINDAPKFMDISPTDMILNQVTEFELSTSVYMLIEQSEMCRQNHIPLKHGALFKGPFGTGKTLAAKVLGRKCVENGWTFLYLAAADQLANGLKLAKMYCPCVVFAEDVDTVVQDRDAGMNDLLNTLDGVDTKDHPIIVVLTTNNADVIDPSFLRAGRMDTVIHFGEPDAETSMRFIQHYSNGALKPDEDLTEVGKSLAGLVPAFLRETVNKATRYTMYREKTADIVGKMTADDLLKAAESVKEQLKLMNKRKPNEFEVIAHAVHQVHRYGLAGEFVPQLADGKRD